MKEAFLECDLACGTELFTPKRLSTAVSASEEWLNNGVRVVFTKDIKSGGAATDNLPPVLFVRGNIRILEKSAAAILNSRTKSPVSPNDSWLSTTKAAFAHSTTRGLALFSGYGSIQYSVVCTLARFHPLGVICHELLPFMAPDRTRTELYRFSEQFPDSENILFISASCPGRLPDRNFRRTERDRLVAELASVILVGEIRKGGNMERILNEAEKKGKEIVRFAGPNKFTKEIQNTKSNSERKKASSSKIPPKNQVKKFEAISKDSRYLIHYTRACSGPWPGQTMDNYCLSLIKGDDGSTHTGFDTLRRIVMESRIRAGSKLIRGQVPVVSFTECNPGEILQLIEWRSGLIRWSFEPYGVAFPLDLLFGMGVRPVIYAIEEAYDDLSDELRYLFQLQSGSGKSWSPEKEWRFRGDFEITQALRRRMVAVVKTTEEALTIEESNEIQTALAGI